MSKFTKHKSRYEPVVSLRRDINDLFDHFWSGTVGLAHQTLGITIDITEDDNAYTVCADMPGINEKDIEVTASHNHLIISAQREHHHKDKKHHTQECYYGQMQRSISLPDNVDTDKIEAKYQKGVLHLHIPKSEAHRPKKINIQS